VVLAAVFFISFSFLVSPFSFLALRSSPDIEFPAFQRVFRVAAARCTVYRGRRSSSNGTRRPRRAVPARAVAVAGAAAGILPPGSEKTFDRG